MEEPNEENKTPEPTTLEHTDNQESFRQLWWTIGVTVLAFAVIAYVYL